MTSWVGPSSMCWNGVSVIIPWDILGYAYTLSIAETLYINCRKARSQKKNCIAYAS
jgi:hypothetical protein